LKAKERFYQKLLIYLITTGEQDYAYQQTLLILRLMLIPDNRDYYLEIKEIEKFFSYC
jgi:hypothetical protein